MFVRHIDLHHALFLFCALTLFAPASSNAEEASGASGDLDGDGRPETVELSRDDDGQPQLIVDSRALSLELGAIPELTGPPRLRVIELGRGRRAGHLSVPVEGEGLAFEAVLFARGRQAPAVVWAGVTGLRGDRGSRWGDRVIIEDLTGDDQPDLLVAAVAEEVPLCGVEAPELFPLALDPANGRLRPVILNRLRHLETTPTALTASREAPEGLTATTPTLSVATFAVASTLLGDRGAVEGLSSPAALADGDPTTAWIEGRPGPGTGEFVTARLLPGPYRVTSLALTLAPAEGDAEAAELGRPRTLTVLLDGPEGPRRYLVTIEDDPLGHRGEPVWVQLPEPVRTSCLSLVLGEVHGGREAPGSTAIAEVAVFTDLDGEGGRERLLEALREGASAVELVLRALGAEAVPLLEAAWDDLDTAARRRAVRVLAALSSPEAAPLLASAALGDDPIAAAEARQGILGLDEAGLEALGAPLTGDDGDLRARAAALIAEIGGPAALELLTRRALAEELPTEDRGPLREALQQLLADAEAEHRAATLTLAAGASGAPRQLLLTALAPVAEAERDQFARLVLDSWTEADSFEDRYRLLSAAAGVGTHPELERLVGEVLSENEDRYLRARAAEVLGQLGRQSEAAARQLASAADDAWTGVRLATAEALGQVTPAAAGAALRVLIHDSWPVVRVAAARSLVQSDPDGAVAPLTTALDDPSEVVQINVARLLGQLGQPTARQPLEALINNDDAPIDARLEAARALGRLCSRPAQQTLVALLHQGREGRHTEEQVRLAAAAAEALALYRSEAITQELLTTAQRGAPGLRIAAIEALARGAHPGARQVLEALTEDPLAPLSAAAGDALRTLDQRPDDAEPQRTCPAE